ncbi:energy-coupling factor ABC transporter ATP-binding protein [Nesterenkonia natronophila]|uniref:ABC transporter ATP-binding protein n=1 Tax=Nesterenkonia natronophila TaxID=2174932 RepID=A0A3A4FA54_9MICC|nr:ABC transporter ATP-binding protein [Nesterenkonia natronophila]RJN32037.1 ABC transporter ATP-binding protein [Nesterenkonia natronophila]
MTSPASGGIAFRGVRVFAGARLLLNVPDLQLTETRITVIGPNGGGKSTLLQLVNGLVEPTEGYVSVDGQDTVDQGRAVRQRTGFVFSSPAAQLVMPTPLEDVELSLRRSLRDTSKRRAAALRCLTELGIAELAERSSQELSSGQQQLVALATVLALRPQILVLDEPTTLLDLVNAQRFNQRVEKLGQLHGITTITATHDLDLAARADRTLLVHDGRIIADGPPGDVISTYRHRSAV